MHVSNSFTREIKLKEFFILRCKLHLQWYGNVDLLCQRFRGWLETLEPNIQRKTTVQMFNKEGGGVNKIGTSEKVLNFCHPSRNLNGSALLKAASFQNPTPSQVWTSFMNDS